ncbi:MAG: Flp pilus assembly complex ATPase component TadA [Desulfovibrio sp.]|jgi:Type II secretory pathway, ATPase PulE/Tfp pilus assembly pathway, ATPase PilB
MTDLLAEFPPDEQEAIRVMTAGKGQDIAEALHASGRIDEDRYLRICSERYGIPYISDLCQEVFRAESQWQPDADILRKLPLAWLRRAHVAPLRRAESLILAVSSPEDIRLAREVAVACGENLDEYVFAPGQEIENIVNKIYGESDADSESVESMLENEETVDINEDSVADLLEESEDAPFIKTVNTILAQALRAGASDIHIEPYRDVSRVRYRLDGVLYERHAIQKAHHAAIVSRIKVMARLDIAEKRLPQDGRIAISLGGRQAGLRVSTLPTSFGERVVLRLLEKNERILSLGELGLAREDFDLVSRLVSMPHGIVLVTGPTGSGKTTTLYAVLQEIASPDKNILTIEDPVEYELDGVGQMQVNPKINLTFADGLRAIVRQDPDVILIGEIRDGETASIAVQSALTGHLVFSTLHTNDAPGAVTRLFDMDVEPFLLSSVLRGVLAQRLVRILCPHCARPAELTPEIRNKFRTAGLSADLRLRETVGCEYCLDTGYKGRMAIYELMPVTDHIKKLIVEKADANMIRAAAIRDGMRTLSMDGLRKAAQGLTSLEEVERVVRL